tara:strand:+ start:664 stop:822 length:159 start_codon:yes stop_codon:yes gene_type:complete
MTSEELDNIIVEIHNVKVYHAEGSLESNAIDAGISALYQIVLRMRASEGDNK